jgi:PAS domain S-box-containing protein
MKKSDDEHEQLLQVIQQLKGEIRLLQEDKRQVQENLQFLYNILASAPIVIWSIDLEGTFTYSQYQKGTGLPYSENIGKSVFDVYKGTNAEIFVKRVLQGEILSDVIDLNGISYDTRVSPMYDHHGIKTGYMGVSLDITERKKLQLEIEEKEKLYRSLMEKSLDGIVISQDGKVIMVNKAFADMLGYSVEECMESFGPESIAPEDRERVLEVHYKRMKGELGDLRYSATIFGKNGTRVIAEFNTTSIEIKGKLASLVTTHDITHRLLMENALRESEEKYRSLIEKALDGILITQDGVFKFVNRSFCEMMQYSEEELLQLPFIRLVDEKHHTEMLENHKRRMQGESFQAIYRAELIRKDGSRIMVELNSRTTDFEGRAASFVITRDITDRLHTEEELRKAKAELEALNRNLEERVKESTLKLTEANTQLIRLQKENLQSQFEVLRQQVNPHFLFNSLNVLTSLIKLEPDLAEKFTEHLSKVYRYVLENKDNDLVSLHTELEFLDAYIFLLQIRFMDKIDIRVDINSADKDKMILPLALQLLIENAIKHNSMSKRNPLIISIFISDGSLLNVVNNLQERESYMASTGVGLKNIEHRYSLLEMPAPQFSKNETQFIARIPLKG